MKSYFIDTNFFLRLLLKDNKKQYHIIYDLFQKAIHQEVTLFTSIIVFFEIYWVLVKHYKHNKQSCVWYLEKILTMDFVNMDNKNILIKSVQLFKQRSLDLEDCYNIAYYKEMSLSNFATFDKKILKII